MCKIKFSAFVSVAIFLGFLSKAQATGGGLFIEPSVGINSGSYTITLVSGLSGNISGSGLAASLKTGYIFSSGLGLGAEYDYASDTDSSSSSKDTLTRANMNVLVGYYKSMGYRYYAGYGLTPKLTYKTTAGEAEFSSGTEFKVGVGFMKSNHMAFNVELMIMEPKKIKNQNGEFDVSTIYSKFTNTAVCFHVAFPFGM